MRNSLRLFFLDESAATSIEYALISSIISVGVIAGYMSLGDALTQVFDSNSAAIEGAIGSGS